MSELTSPGFAEDVVRARARDGRAGVFPPTNTYGRTLLGANTSRTPADRIDAMTLVPPIFMEQRLEKLVELGREPMYSDVSLDTEIGGFTSPLPVFVSAFGSTAVASNDLGLRVSRQAGRLGIPMVIGENVVPMNGYGRPGSTNQRGLLGRIRAYTDELADTHGGVVIQQSTEDADAEVWNLVYSDPATQSLLRSGRLGFELKVGQGAKPGLGGMTVLDQAAVAAVADHYAVDLVFGESANGVLRCSSPGTFTEEILRQQIRLMRNNFPRASVWVKLPPGRDVDRAVLASWSAGAQAVTVDGAEGGTGWAPSAFLEHVGLSLADCLARIGYHPSSCLLVNGRMWAGARAVKTFALGARAVGLGRAALLAVDEDPERGLQRIVECMDLEMRLLISALGKYTPRAVAPEDVFVPAPERSAEFA